MLPEIILERFNGVVGAMKAKLPDSKVTGVLRARGENPLASSPSPGS
jgi:hypothetical protein